MNHKVLIVMGPIVRGGAELQIFEIIRLIDRNAFEPVVCSVRYRPRLPGDVPPPSPADIDLRDQFRGLGILVYQIENYSLYDLRGIAEIFRIIRQEQIDLVHVNLVLWGQIAGLLARVPTVPHVRGELNAPDMPRLAYWANFCMYRFSKAVLAVSQAIKEQVTIQWHVDRQKIHVVHSGIDIGRFDPQKENGQLDLRTSLAIGAAEKVVIAVGNTRPIKGFQYFVQMAAEISQQRADVRFLLVGDGPSLEELKAQAYTLGLQKKVLFLGSRTDVPQLLAMADVFVLTSSSEASPGSVKEAMAMELPVVATDVGGLSEIVKEGASGFLVHPGDPPELAERVHLLLKNETQARAFGRRGRKIVTEKFTSMQMVLGVEKVYKDVLGIV